MAYQGYDASVDYADRLMRMMQAGASAAEVEDTLRRRVQKASQEPGHEQYVYDAYYKAARDYIDRANQYPGVSQAGTPDGAYKNPYADRLERAVSRLEQREPFSYDPETDPAFQSYQAAYRREGERAAKNSLGDAAALTGGQASTAAVAAASQARDYYNSKVGDVVPKLYQMAWQMYQGEQNGLLNEIEMLAGLSDRAYAQEMNNRELDYKIFADQRDFGYRQYQDVLEREEGAAKAWADNSYRQDSLNLQYDRMEQERQHQNETMEQNSRKDAYNRAMAFLNAGVMPTAAMLRAADIDRETARSLYAAALRKLNQ